MELDKTTRDQLFNKLNYEDLQAMTVRQMPGRAASSIPAFASNDLQMKSVLTHAAITYIYRGKRKPPQQIIEDLKHLDAAAHQVHERELKIVERWSHMDEHFAAIDAAGGYLPLLAAIAYRAWRMRWHNRDIAFSLAMKPHAVQHILDKLKHIATFLGFETCRPTGRRLAWLEARGKPIDDKIVEIWKAGKSTGQIVRELHTTYPRVTNLLRWKGLYQWRRRVVRHGFKRPNTKRWLNKERPPKDSKGRFTSAIGNEPRQQEIW